MAMIGEYTSRSSRELDDTFSRWLMRRELDTTTNEINGMPFLRFVEYVKDLCRDDLLEIKNYLDAKNAEIKLLQKTTFVPNHRAVENKRRSYGRRSNAIQTELSKSVARRTEYQIEAGTYESHQKTLQQHFVDVSFETLDEETYFNIMKLAKERDSK